MTDQGTNGQRSQPPAAAISMRDLLSPIAIVVAGLMISGSIIWSVRLQPQPPSVQSTTAATPTQPAQAPPPAADIAKVKIEGEPFIGDANAPVVMAYWFDYQCPFCKQVEETVFPQLIKDYVDTGKLKVVFKDFAILGPDSQTAAIAARAVWETAPEKFGAWHKAMFDKQDEENSGWGNQNDITAMTRTVAGIDAAKVDALAASQTDKYNAAISADGEEGNSQGVGGTPSFLIGKQMIVGAVPYERLKAAIDQMLASK